MTAAKPKKVSEANAAITLARSAARLAAVQVLYQLEYGGGSAETAVDEFLSHRVGVDLDGDRFAAPDADLFRSLVRGASGRGAEIDALLKGSLTGQRDPARLDGILRALLRVAAFELLARPEVPAKVAITEYIDVAHAFFTGPEPKLVNGVLDNLARFLRPAEFS